MSGSGSNKAKLWYNEEMNEREEAQWLATIALVRRAEEDLRKKVGAVTTILVRECPHIKTRTQTGVIKDAPMHVTIDFKNGTLEKSKKYYSAHIYCETLAAAKENDPHHYKFERVEIFEKDGEKVTHDDSYQDNRLKRKITRFGSGAKTHQATAEDEKAAEKYNKEVRGGGAQGQAGTLQEASAPPSAWKHPLQRTGIVNPPHQGEAAGRHHNPLTHPLEAMHITNPKPAEQEEQTDAPEGQEPAKKQSVKEGKKPVPGGGWNVAGKRGKKGKKDDEGEGGGAAGGLAAGGERKGG